MNEEQEQKMLEDAIKIDDEYFLKKDSRCWILLYYRKKQKKDGSGETYDYDPTYHANLAGALTAYLDKRAMEAHNGVAELLAKIKDAEQRIEHLCKDVPSLFKAAN